MTSEEFYVENGQDLRNWLAKNHTTSKGIWIVYDMKGTGNRTITYDEIVEEVLCFGWVDSLPRSKDKNQAMYYISPRKPKSPWSKLNKQRIEKLTKEKRITLAGLDVVERSKKDRSWISYDAIESLVIPTDLKSALSNDKKAQENFDKFSNSSKKQILWYVTSANMRRQEIKG